MTRSLARMHWCLCMILISGGPIFAQSQTPIAPSFFGADSSTCDPVPSVTPCHSSGLWEPWWPPASTPAVNIGSAGKVAQSTWDAMDNNIASLAQSPQSTAPYYYFTGTVNWARWDTYVQDAISANVPIHYTFMQQPQWAVCFDYGPSLGGPRYGGPLGPRSSGYNPDAVDCSSGTVVPFPYNIIYTSASSSCPKESLNKFSGIHR